jgi:ubiquinone biosynthesis protein
MPDWNFLVDERTLATVLPDAYARYRLPIAGALAVFLEGLSEAHQATLLADQAALPPTASPAERLAALARSCPALHKLGQILARDRRLSPDLRKHLQELESLRPSVAVEVVEEILTRELGPLDRLGVTLSPPLLAEASVAVVLPFREPRGNGEDATRDGVFKVLKPGIEERLEQELELFERVGSYLDQKCDDCEFPHLDYRESFELVRDKLRDEIRLDLEQRHLVQARAVYAEQPLVQIPALFEHCTSRVTAMERVVGRKVTEHGLNFEGEKRRLAELVIKAMIARPIFLRANQALFHADPHAGNLFLTRDQRLAILDWSLVGSLGERERVALAQITLSALTFHAERIVTILVGLDERQRIDRRTLESVVHAWLARIRQGQFPGFTWLLGLLDEAVQTARLRVGSDLLLFRKTLYTLEGVIADIGAEASCMDDVLLGVFLGHFAVEWPARWFALPDSRMFATRLANGDLLHLLLRLPWTAVRFWLDQANYALAPANSVPILSPSATTAGR